MGDIGFNRHNTNPGCRSGWVDEDAAVAGKRLDIADPAIFSVARKLAKIRYSKACSLLLPETYQVTENSTYPEHIFTFQPEEFLFSTTDILASFSRGNLASSSPQKALEGYGNHICSFC